MAVTAPSPTDSAPNSAWKPELHEIPLNAIDLADNVRADVGNVDDLAASIRLVGVLEPIRVAEAGAGRYRLLFGQRRLVAAREAGLGTIPAIVLPAVPTNIDTAVVQLIENLHREDLNALDTAKAYRAILDAGLSQRELANLVGLAQPTIANTLALLKAPEELQAKVAAGELTRSHVEAIVKLPKAEQKEIARRVVEHGLSVDDVRDEIQMAARRATAERSREEERKNQAAGRLQTVIDLLATKKADPKKVTLVGYLGTAGDVLEQLKLVGWKVKVGGSEAPAKGICDCTALALTFTYNWPGGKQVEKAHLAKACILSKHQATAAKAQRDAWETEQRARREVEQREADERAAALAPLAVAVTTAMPPTKAKLILFAMLGAVDNDYYEARHWTAARGVEHFPYGEWREHLWAAIDALEHGPLLQAIAELVAQAAVDAGGKVRSAIDALAKAKS